MNLYFWVHVVIAAALAAYFGIRWWRERQPYELLFVIWVPTTLLSYVRLNAVFRILLIVFQLLMFALILFFMFRKPSKPDAEQPPREDAPAKTETGEEEPKE